ncbi:MAG: hypothetical protein ACLFS9_09095 [Nitriliruptoraceae bacterium]
MAETTATDRPAAKKTAKKTATRKTSTASSTRKPAAKKTTRKTTAKKTAARKPAAPKTPSLRERELKVILEDAGYATAGLVNDVVSYAKAIPGQIERLRDDAEHLVEDTPDRLKGLREVPEKAEKTLADLRKRLEKDADRYLRNFEKRFDAKAKEGRKLAEDVRKDERVDRVLSQAGNARSQLKGAFTSVSRTADVAVDTAHKQAGTVTTQAKATATTARRAVDETVAKAKGTVTATKGAAGETLEATEEQFEHAKQQTKAAATSVKRTVDAAGDAAGDATS